MTVEEIRAQIDRADDEISALFVRRMELVRMIAAAKREEGVPTNVPGREDAIIRRTAEKTPESLRPYSEQLFRTLFDLSKKYQINLSRKQI